MSTLEFTGTGGIWEGSAGAANVVINQDSALYFSGDTADAISDHVTMGDNDLVTTGSMTLSCWFKPEANTTQGACLIGKQSSYDANDLGYGLYWRAANTTIYFNIGDGSNGERLNISGNDYVGKWVHLAGTYNSTSKAMVLYVNGVSVATGTATSVGDLSASNTDHLRLGANGADPDEGDAHFKGYIADARIYTYVHDQPAVAALASKINIDDPHADSNHGMVGWWKCNEGTGHAIVDYHNVGTDFDGAFKRNDANYSTDIWKFDQYSVNVHDATTTTTGNFTVTQGKLEGKTLTSLDFERTNTDFVSLASTMSKPTLATYAVWMKPETSGSNYGYTFAESNNKGWYYYTTDDCMKSVGLTPSLTGTTGSVPENVWTHFAVTYDGTTSTMYINGVADVSGTGDHRLDLARLGDDNGDGAECFDGKLRDWRVYDYCLSADQMASLYSGSYNVTPLHWWTAHPYDLSGASNVVADTGTATAITGTKNGAAWDDGTLNLDDRFTIEANGSFSAPRGTLEFSGNLDINCTNVDITSAGNQFIHNNGKFTAKDAVDAFCAPNNATFFNFDLDTTTGHDFDLRESITILGTLDLTASTDVFIVDAANAAGNITITMGNADNQAIIESNTADTLRFNPHATREILITGGSSLKPCRVTGQDWKWDNGAAGAAGIKLANMKFEVAVVTDTGTGNAVKIILTGDCEFDALTVSVGDTIDLKGQRIQLSGMFNTGQLNDSASSGGQIWSSSGINWPGFTSDGSLTTTDYISTASSTHYIKPFPFRTVMVNGGSGSAPAFGNYAPSIATTNFILGSGTLNNIGQDASATGTMTVNNATIATGGVLTAGGATLSCAGDFTTSGGLIGKSALNLTGVIHANGSDNLVEISDENKFTVEGWFNAPAGSGYRHLFSRGTSWAAGNVTVYLHSDGTIQASAYEPSSTISTATDSWDDGKWHHVAYTYDTSNLKLYVDGKLEATAASTAGLSAVSGGTGFEIGSRGSANWVGQIGRVSIWKSALSETLIRKMMFMDWTTMAADSDFTDGDAVGWWQFDEGTSTAVVDSSTSNGTNNATLTTAAWAGAGTLTWTESGGVPSAGTLNMSDDGILTYYEGIEFFNITLAASSKFTRLYSFPISTRNLHIHGTLTSGGGSIPATNSPNLIFLGDSTAAGNPNFSSCNFQKWRSTTAIPQMTSSYLFIDSIDATLGADHVNTGYIRPSGNRTLNFSSYSMTTPRFYLGDGNSGLDLDSGSLILTGSSSEAAANARLTGGPGCEIKSSVSGTKRNMPSNPDWEITGDMTDINIIDGGSHGSGYGITIVGSASNCSGQIRQWHHTLDTQQLLDADELGTDDIKLPNPSLDNALELDTGG